MAVCFWKHVKVVLQTLATRYLDMIVAEDDGDDEEGEYTKTVRDIDIERSLTQNLNIAPTLSNPTDRLRQRGKKGGRG